MNGLRFEIHSTPTLELARVAAQIGSIAWRDRFPQYTEVQRQHVFDPANPGCLHQKMEGAAEVGKFVGVVAVQESTDEPIGFVWGAEDISAKTIEEREAKRAAGKVYAWSAQMNVSPDRQHHGIGTTMLDTFLSKFDGTMRPTSYVFLENQPTLLWHQNLGYERTPDRFVPALPARAVPKRYFGKDAPPVHQVRLVGPSTGAVRANIARLYPQMPKLDDRHIVGR